MTAQHVRTGLLCDCVVCLTLIDIRVCAQCNLQRRRSTKLSSDSINDHVHLLLCVAKRTVRTRRTSCECFGVVRTTVMLVAES